MTSPRTSANGFTLLELMIVTVVLSILALIVAQPLSEARERAMVAAAQGHMRATISAVEQFRIVHGQLPRTVADLAEFGVTGTQPVAICAFTFVPASGPDPAHVAIEVKHRASESVVRTRQPDGTGTEVIAQADASPSCRD